MDGEVEEKIVMPIPDGLKGIRLATRNLKGRGLT